MYVLKIIMLLIVIFMLEKCFNTFLARYGVKSIKLDSQNHN